MFYASAIRWVYSNLLQFFEVEGIFYDMVMILEKQPKVALLLISSKTYKMFTVFLFHILSFSYAIVMFGKRENT